MQKAPGRGAFVGRGMGAGALPGGVGLGLQLRRCAQPKGGQEHAETLLVEGISRSSYGRDGVLRAVVSPLIRDHEEALAEFLVDQRR